MRRARRLRRAAGGWEGVLGVAIGLLLVLVAIAAPVLAPHDPDAIASGRVIAQPTAEFPFGSDALGRDVLSRVMYALRVSLSVAIASVAISLVLGVPLGLIAGYFGGWIDTVLMRPIDVLLAFPALLLAIAIIAIVGPGSSVALVAIAVIYLPILSRVVRSSVLITREQGYVAGARARGASPTKIMLGHILPTRSDRSWPRRAC